MIEDIIKIMTEAAIENDSGPKGSKLFKIHYNEFYAGYEESMKAALKALDEKGYVVVHKNG